MDRNTAHRAKMASKKASRATMTTGWIKQGPAITFLEAQRLSKTDGKLDLRPRPSKSDSAAYRKPFARDFHRAA